MLKARVPKGAIELKMSAKGLDVKILDKDPESVVDISEKKENQMQWKDHPDYGPFFKMLKARVPKGAIELKMSAKGLDVKILDKDPESVVDISEKKENQMQWKDHPDYGPFFKMLKARVPKGAIELKMSAKGLDVKILDKDPESVVDISEKKENQMQWKDHPDYGPFFKMLKARVPKGAIELKMSAKGLDIKLLEKDPESFVNINEVKKPVLKPKGIKLKDDKDYGEFFRMLKAKVPRGAIELKMSQKKLLIGALDLDPDNDISILTTLSSRTAVKPLKIVKRKKVEKVCNEKPKPKKERLLRRKVHWKQISKHQLKSDPGSIEPIWIQLKKLRFGLDEKTKADLLKHFTAKPQPKVRKVNEKSGEKQKKKTGLVLLDMQRSNNISIVLSRMSGITGPNVQRALCTLEIPDEVSEEEFIGVLNLVPTVLEEKKLKQFTGDRTTLAKPEQYFLSLLDVNKYKTKIDIFLFKLKFEQEVDGYITELDTVISCCLEILTSKKFQKMLSILLTVGNLINDTSAEGFGLESLLTLDNTKSFVGKLTVLSYFAKLLCEQHREILGYINSTVEKLQHGASIPYNHLMSELRQLETQFSIVEREHEKLGQLVEKQKKLEKPRPKLKRTQTTPAIIGNDSWFRVPDAIVLKKSSTDTGDLSMNGCASDIDALCIQTQKVNPFSKTQVPTAGAMAVSDEKERDTAQTRTSKGDPRNAMLAAIQNRKKETPPPPTSGGDPRNAMLAVIQNRKKETPPPPASGGDPRNAMLATIQNRKKETPTPPTSGGDPRNAMLAAIQNRKKETPPPPTSGGDPRNAMLAAIQNRKKETPPPPTSGGDPRNAMLAAIQNRKKETPPPPTSGGDPRNAMLAAIQNRKKETPPPPTSGGDPRNAMLAAIQNRKKETPPPPTSGGDPRNAMLAAIQNRKKETPPPPTSGGDPRNAMLAAIQNRKKETPPPPASGGDPRNAMLATIQNRKKETPTPPTSEGNPRNELLSAISHKKTERSRTKNVQIKMDSKTPPLASTKKTVPVTHQHLAKEDMLFFTCLQVLYDNTMKKLSVLRPKKAEVEKGFNDLCIYLCESPKTTSTEKILSTISNFMKKVLLAVKSNEEARARELKRQRQKEEKEQALKKRKQKEKKKKLKRRPKTFAPGFNENDDPQGVTRSGAQYGVAHKETD
eukprot:maker-scaffold_3-snap-gene-9.47-mRNA-1 protein AED:0.29 eAED:0.30 QI:0/0/0/1/1/1/4/0/1165